MYHLLTANGLKAVEAIDQATKPTDNKSLKWYLGFVNYMAKFLPNLSTFAEPLRKLTCAEAEWMWESSQEEAYQQIKKKVSKSTQLQYYDVTKQVTIQCDSSDYGLGAALVQEGKPEAFASRTMPNTGRRYVSIEK